MLQAGSRLTNLCPAVSALLCFALPVPLPKCAAVLLVPVILLPLLPPATKPPSPVHKGPQAWAGPCCQGLLPCPCLLRWALTCSAMQTHAVLQCSEHITSACSYIAYRQVFVPWAVLLFMAQIAWSGLRIVGGIWRGTAAPDGYNI